MVRFLHAADLHLGIRITRFNATIAGKIREARFQALDSLIQLARAEKPDFLLIAGDLFDDHAVDKPVAQRCADMLESAGLPVYVLPGNHDPVLLGSVWDRSPWDSVGNGCIRLLRTAAPLFAGPGVQILPCPVLRKTCLHDPTRWIAAVPPSDNAIRIGVAHGSLKIRD